METKTWHRLNAFLNKQEISDLEKIKKQIDVIIDAKKQYEEELKFIEEHINKHDYPKWLLYHIIEMEV